MTAATHGRSGRPWRRLREQVLREEPYCTIRGPKCKGISTTVDHIVALSVAPELAHERSNLRGACSSCNFAGGSRITNARGRVLPLPVIAVCRIHTDCGGAHSKNWYDGQGTLR